MCMVWRHGGAVCVSLGRCVAFSTGLTALCTLSACIQNATLAAVQDAMKANDIARLESAIEAAKKAGLGPDEGVKAAITHVAFLHEERALVEELRKVRAVLHFFSLDFRFYCNCKVAGLLAGCRDVPLA